MKRKVALYDFDKTVVNCESIVELYKYAYKNKKINIFKSLWNLAVAYIKSKLNSDFEIMKNQMVSVIKYLTEDDLQDFVTNYLYPKFFFSEFEDEFSSYDESLTEAWAGKFLRQMSMDIKNLDLMVTKFIKLPKIKNVNRTKFSVKVKPKDLALLIYGLKRVIINSKIEEDNKVFLNIDFR